MQEVDSDAQPVKPGEASFALRLAGLAKRPRGIEGGAQEVEQADEAEGDPGERPFLRATGDGKGDGGDGARDRHDAVVDGKERAHQLGGVRTPKRAKGGRHDEEGKDRHAAENQRGRKIAERRRHRREFHDAIMALASVGAQQTPWRDKAKPLSLLAMSASSRFLVFLLACLVFAFPGATGAQGVREGKREALAIQTSTARHLFQVERAKTPDEQAQGLMYRRSMAADHGMLFDMVPPRVATFCMKNTFIPLDMIFVGPDGRIRNIAERTVPETTSTYSSDGPVGAVLELNGGTSSRLGIKPGDLVLHPLFGTAK